MTQHLHLTCKPCNLQICNQKLGSDFCKVLTAHCIAGEALTDKVIALDGFDDPHEGAGLLLHVQLLHPGQLLPPCQVSDQQRICHAVGLYIIHKTDSQSLNVSDSSSLRHIKSEVTVLDKSQVTVLAPEAEQCLQVKLLSPCSPLDTHPMQLCRVRPVALVLEQQHDSS